MNLTTHKLSEQIDRKFIEQFEVSDWEVETDTGWEDVTFSNKTIEYEVFHIKLKNGMELKCADNHILFDENFNEIFAKNTLGTEIQTKFGTSKVVSVEDLGYSENMYDLTVGSSNHRFYTNDILSHNTITSAAYILWYTLFQEVKTVAILANKATAAREVMSRYQMMYEHLPIWLQQGIKTWNKGDIELENGSKIFTQATTTSGIRGKSCVTGDTLVCIEDGDALYYTAIDSILNKSNLTDVEMTKKFWILYRTTNTINNKIYVGVHGANKIEDGYLGSGKLLKEEIKKYGPDKFVREVLHIADNLEEVELLEALYVDKEFIKREDNYNISLGGNVCILYGKDNGFFGKHHSEEVKKIISDTHIGNKYVSNASENGIVDTANGKYFCDLVEAKKEFPALTRYTLINLIGQGKMKYANQKWQEQALLLFSERLTVEEKREILVKTARKTFTGSKQAPDQISKRVEASKKYWNENPEEHIQRMLKINKNPEKIKKTAEKHRGMIRSEEARKNITDSLLGNTPHNKGKIVIHNSFTREIMTVDADHKIELPWKRGSGPRS
jgi:hypothetical protein